MDFCNKNGYIYISDENIPEEHSVFRKHASLLYKEMIKITNTPKGKVPANWRDILFSDDLKKDMLQKHSFLTNEEGGVLSGVTDLSLCTNEEMYLSAVITLATRITEFPNLNEILE